MLLLMLMSSFVADLSLLVLLLLNQQLYPLPRFQGSDCSTFCIMCEEPSIVVFVVTLWNDFLVWLPNFSLNLVTIMVAPVITGIILHFRFCICCISIHVRMCFSFFSASFCTTFLSAGIATSISVHVFSFLF